MLLNERKLIYISVDLKRFNARKKFGVWTELDNVNKNSLLLVSDKLLGYNYFSNEDVHSFVGLYRLFISTKGNGLK